MLFILVPLSPQRTSSVLENLKLPLSLRAATAKDLQAAISLPQSVQCKPPFDLAVATAVLPDDQWCPVILLLTPLTGLPAFMQATLYVYEMKDGEMAVTKIEHPDPASAET